MDTALRTPGIAESYERLLVPSIFDLSSLSAAEREARLSAIK